MLRPKRDVKLKHGAAGRRRWRCIMSGRNLVFSLHKHSIGPQLPLIYAHLPLLLCLCLCFSSVFLCFFAFCILISSFDSLQFWALLFWLLLFAFLLFCFLLFAFGFWLLAFGIWLAQSLPIKQSNIPPRALSHCIVTLLHWFNFSSSHLFYLVVPLFFSLIF